MPRTRLHATCATERRIDATTRLVRRLMEAPMDQHEIATFLGFSPSGARKYSRELILAGVAAMSYVGRARSRLYSITDPALAEAWLVRLAMTERARPRGSHAPGARLRAIADGVHLMADDAPFSVKRAYTGPAWREPLVAALFGPPGPAGPAEPPEPVAAQPPEQPAGPPGLFTSPQDNDTMRLTQPSTPDMVKPFDWTGGRIDWSAP